MEQSSRVSIERALGASRATTIAQETVGEIMTAAKHRTTLLTLIGNKIKTMNPKGASADIKTNIDFLLDIIDPAPASAKPPAIAFAKKKPPVRMAEGLYFTEGAYMPTGKSYTAVAFGVGEIATIKPDISLQIHQDEINSGMLRISDVRIRPVSLRYEKSTVEQNVEGLAWAQVSVSVRMGRDWHTRKCTVEHRFWLRADQDAGVKPPKDIWVLECNTDPLKREVLDDNPVTN